MNKKIARKWVKALRSGEYAQGKHVLCKQGKEYDYFCCLGVLVAETTGFEGFNHKGEGYADVDPTDGWLNISMMDEEYLSQFGLSRDDAHDLAEMNDAGKRFTTIANYIEKKYL